MSGLLWSITADQFCFELHRRQKRGFGVGTEDGVRIRNGSEVKNYSDLSAVISPLGKSMKIKHIFTIVMICISFFV